MGWRGKNVGRVWLRGGRVGRLGEGMEGRSERGKEV